MKVVFWGGLTILDIKTYKAIAIKRVVGIAE